jgi:uncharacterized protein YciI
MKLVVAIVILFSSFGHAQENKDEKKFEMKKYFFVMLKKGPTRNQDSLAAAKLQEGHMANIHRMADEKKLAIAGPFGDDGDWRGIFILDVATAEEAKAQIDRDPAVQAGRLVYEIHPWWSERGAKLP